MSRLLALASLVIVGGGCGAETVGSGEPVDTSSYRVEVQSEMTGIGPPESFTSTNVVSGEASTSVDETGCRLIGIGGTSYTELPDGAGLHVGKHWIRSDDDEDSEEWLEDVTQPDGFVPPDGVSEVYVLAEVIAYGSAGPTEYLAELRKDAEPQPVGEETIDGVTTTHFRATVDNRRRMRRQLEEGGWKAERIDAYLAQRHPSELIVDVWVDDAGVARRVRERTEGFVTTSDYSDFGHQEVIVPPPAAEVVDEHEWMLIQQRQEQETDASWSVEGSAEPSCG